MAGLPSKLYNRCRNTLLKCSEFDSNASLRAVFVTSELQPFRSQLPEAANKTERVDVFLDYLLPKRLSDGQSILPFFLESLRGKYLPGDALHDELASLIDPIRTAFVSSNISSSEPSSTQISPIVPKQQTLDESAGSNNVDTASEVERSPEPSPSSTPSTSSNAFWDFLSAHPLLWVVGGVIFVILIAVLFFERLRCVLEYRLTEATVALIAFLAIGAALAFMVAPSLVRKAAQSFYGGFTFASIILVLVMIFLPPPQRQNCFSALEPIATAESSSSTQITTASPTQLPIPTATITLSPTLVSKATNPVRSATILSPLEGDEVSIKTNVMGEASKIPNNHKLWLLVQASDSTKYYPLKKPLEVNADGYWQTVTSVGRNLASEWSKPFTIAVVLANSHANQQLLDFVDVSPMGNQALDLPEGAVIQDSVRVVRTNPIVTVDSHPAEVKVQRFETIAGTYAKLSHDFWHLYGIVEVDKERFIPYGPFKPTSDRGEWMLEVEFPWPPGDDRVISFYALTVLLDTPADKKLSSAIGSYLGAHDLSDEDKTNVYGPIAKTSLVRAERVAFASEKPGNDDIYVINADGAGLVRLTNHPSGDTDPAWSPDATRIVFVSERDDGLEQLFIMDANGKNVHRVMSDTVMHARAPNWSPDSEWIAFHSWTQGNLDIYKVRPDGTELIRLTDDPAEDSSPVWSPDGERLTFLSDRLDAGADKLFLMDPDGSNVIRLTESEGSEGFAVWSPDGQHVLFAGDLEGSRDIYLIDADGSNLTRVANVDHERHPSFAPDGQRFVFDSSMNNRQLFLAAIEGEEPVQIQTGLAKSFLPMWSPVPKDERIVFVGRSDGDWEIYTMWSDGSDPLRLMDTETSNEIQPRLSPDGRQVVFASDIDGNYSIWLEDARTPAPWTRLTDDSANDWQPAWSPDGRKLAFASDRNGNWDIYVMNSNGTGVIQLTDDPDEDSFPAWSPDGNHIVFYSRRSGDGDIYVMDAANGANEKPLITNPGFDWSPTWSPDGSTILFASSRDYGDNTYRTEVYALEMLSGDLSRLTNYPGRDSIPLWSSDGLHIYFTSDRYSGIDDIWVMDADGSNTDNLTEDEREDIFGGP